jgi:chemotaxis protein histidine kinase CheA
MVEFYLASGGNYEDVYSRLPNDQLILKFVKKFKEDNTYKELLSALEDKNYKDAFRASHTMKGLSMTLGFETLCEHVSNMTELLREYKEENKDEVEKQLTYIKEEYTNLIKNIDDLYV